MTTEACPVCGKSTTHNRLLTGREGYGDIYRCAECRLTRLLPVPTRDEHHSAVAGMYRREAEVFSTKKLALARRSAEGYLAHLRRLGREVRSLVDLAGGLGYYARAFAERGLDVTYVDVDPVSAEFARRHHGGCGLTIHESAIEDFCTSADRTFDVVFLRHVIEHCIDPDRTLDLIRRISGPATTLVLETDNNAGIELLCHPDAGSYWRNVYRAHYPAASVLSLLRLRPLAIDLTETHYYAFRLDNLARLLRRTSWTVLDDFHYALGDRTYWPNVRSARDVPWWRPRRDLRAWGHDFLYAMASPMLRGFGLTSGLAVYAGTHGNGGKAITA